MIHINTYNPKSEIKLPDKIILSYNLQKMVLSISFIQNFHNIFHINNLDYLN